MTKRNFDYSWAHMNAAVKTTDGKHRQQGQASREDARKAINHSLNHQRGQPRPHIAERLTSSFNYQPVGRIHEIYPRHVSPNGFHNLDKTNNLTDHN